MILLPWAGDRRPWLDYMAKLLARGTEPVSAVECVDSTTYAGILHALIWGSRFVPIPGDGLTIIEHDIWPTPAELERLSSSHHLIETIPYTFERATHPSHWSAEGWSVRGDGRPEWTDYSGLGCIRFRPGALVRLELPPTFGGTDWRNVDRAISRAAGDAGIPIHVSWPAVEHR